METKIPEDFEKRWRRMERHLRDMEEKLRETLTDNTFIKEKLDYFLNELEKLRKNKKDKENL